MLLLRGILALSPENRIVAWVEGACDAGIVYVMQGGDAAATKTGVGSSAWLVGRFRRRCSEFLRDDHGDDNMPRRSKRSRLGRLTFMMSLACVCVDSCRCAYDVLVEM